MSTPTTISAFPAPISAPVKPPEEGEEEEVVVHHHDVPFLPQGGWIAEKLGLLGTGLRQVFNSWRSAVTSRQPNSPTAAPRISTRDSGSDTSSSEAAPLPPLAGNTGAEDVPIAKKVVNAAHSVMEHLGQEAAAVTGTLKDEADELKGSHPLHTTPEHLAPPAGSPTSHAGGGHMSVAGKVTNAMHSTLDHMAQDTEAVSSSVKEELSSFQHHHAVSPAGAHA